MNETMVTVTGNVAGDVVARRVGGNEEHLLVTFRVASSERRWDKASETWVDGDRFTASVNCWRRLAEGAQASLVKGDPVVVTGRLSVREYETDAGRRYMTEIAATAVGPDLSRCTAQVRRRRSAAAEATEAAEAAEAAEAPVGAVATVATEATEVTGVTETTELGESVPMGRGARPGGGGRPVRRGAAGAREADDELARAARPLTAPDPVQEVAAGATVAGTDTGERRRDEPVRASA